MFIAIVSLILLLIVSYLIIYIINQYKILQYLSRKYRIPPYHFIIGHLLSVKNLSASGIFSVLTNFTKDFGRHVLLVGVFYKSFLLLSSPTDIEILFAKPNKKASKKSDDYNLLEPWLGTGLLTSNGEKWFQRRKIITPVFHFTSLEPHIRVFVDQSNILVEKMKLKCNKNDFNIYNDITLFALDVICETTMGTIINAQSKPNSEYVLAIKEMSLLLHYQSFSIFKYLPSLYKFTKGGIRQRELLKILHSFTIDVITKRRNQILNNYENIQNNHKFFLDILLTATINGNSLTNEDIREEVDTFMFEGHDTTTSGISFTIYFLSKYQNIQEKVYRECVEVFSNNDDRTDFTHQNLNKLKYLETVIKESLRLMPPVPFIGRKLTKPVEIDNIKIPANINVIIPIYALHRDPEFFPDPDTFQPDRFDLKNQTDHPFAYIPFSAGERNCIGQKFAMLEMKTVIAKLIMNFKIFESINQDPLMLQADLILKSANGIKIRLENRSN